MGLLILIMYQYKFWYINFLFHSHHLRRNQICFRIMTFLIIVLKIMSSYKQVQNLQHIALSLMKHYLPSEFIIVEYASVLLDCMNLLLCEDHLHHLNMLHTINLLDILGLHLHYNHFIVIIMILLRFLVFAFSKNQNQIFEYYLCFSRLFYLKCYFISEMYLLLIL